MKLIPTILAAGLAIAPFAAHAQSASAISNSAAGAYSGSASGAGAQINQQFNGANGIRYGGGYTVHNTPDVQSPVFAGGTNACTVSAGGGVAVAGFGVAGGASWSDSNCERRAESAMLYLEGQHVAAVALLCQFADVAKAMGAAGTPCPAAPVAQVHAAPLAFAVSRPVVCHFETVLPSAPGGAAETRKVCER